MGAEKRKMCTLGPLYFWYIFVSTCGKMMIMRRRRGGGGRGAGGFKHQV